MTVAFSFTLTGLAAARQPASLVAEQARDATATQVAPGYRDAHARFQAVWNADEAILSSGGYRDLNVRFGTASGSEPRTAGALGKTVVR